MGALGSGESVAAERRVAASKASPAKKRNQLTQGSQKGTAFKNPTA